MMTKIAACDRDRDRYSESSIEQQRSFSGLGTGIHDEHTLRTNIPHSTLISDLIHQIEYEVSRQDTLLWDIKKYRLVQVCQSSTGKIPISDGSNGVNQMRSGVKRSLHKYRGLEIKITMTVLTVLRAYPKALIRPPNKVIHQARYRAEIPSSSTIRLAQSTKPLYGSPSCLKLEE